MPAVFAQMKSQTKQSIQELAEAIRMEMTDNGKFDFICKKDKGNVIVLMMEYTGLGYAFFNKYTSLTIVLSAIGGWIACRDDWQRCRMEYLSFAGSYQQQCN